MYTLPWLFCLAAAIWFGARARRVRHNWLLWAAGGAVFGLVSTTMIEGVYQAAFVPVSHDAVVLLRLKLLAMDIFSVGFLGWLATLDLRRRDGALWKGKGQGNPLEKGENLTPPLPQPPPPEAGPARPPSLARAR